MGLTTEMIESALGWAYDKAVNGLPGLDSAIDMAESYAKEPGSKIDQANALIRWQVTKSATAGFVTALR